MILAPLENKYSCEKKSFIGTIFGVTNQVERTLNAKLYDDNTILAVSEKVRSLG